MRQALAVQQEIGVKLKERRVGDRGKGKSRHRWMLLKLAASFGQTVRKNQFPLSLVMMIPFLVRLHQR